MKLWIAIPTDGRRHTLSLALASIMLQAFPLTGVLIFENGARFGTEQVETVQMLKFLRGSGTRVVVECGRLPREGFTKLRHDILVLCGSLGASHVLMMDDDAMLHPEALGKLVKLAEEDPRFGWATPVLLYPEGLLSSWGRDIAPQWKPLLKRWSSDDGPAILQNVVPLAATTCLLIDLPRAMELGGFDFYPWLPDFAEDRYFTARFFGRYTTYVHRTAECYVTSGLENEGRRWKMPVSKLLLQESLVGQLHPSVLQLLRNEEALPPNDEAARTTDLPKTEL